MSVHSFPPLPALSERPAQAIRTVLIVDDSRSQRLLIAAGLRDAGYSVLQAANGREALDLCARLEVDLVLSDWMMPGMTGIDLCRALRAAQSDRYIYFILLTSKSGKSALAEGLGVGADDFLAKPVDNAELRARIKAGDRLLALERELRANNRLLTDALGRLNELYQTLDNDLAEARSLQMSLVPQRTHRLAGGQVSVRLRSAGHVGGDMVGFFEIDRRRLGLYAIDVSGHGMAAALLTTRLAGLFSGTSSERNIALRPGPDGPEVRSPSAVAAALHRLMMTELQSERYLTLGYAEIDRQTGDLRLVQAGHPHPVIQHADGRVSRLGSGGLPLGLIDDGQWQDIQVRLAPGERLLIVSDGVVECPGREGGELGQEGFERLLIRLADLRGQALIEGLIWELTRFSGSEDFPDDISFAMFEFTGPTRPAPDGPRAEGRGTMAPD